MERVLETCVLESFGKVREHDFVAISFGWAKRKGPG